MIAPFLLFWLTIASGRGQLSGGGRWRAALLYLPVFFLILGDTSFSAHPSWCRPTSSPDWAAALGSGS